MVKRARDLAPWLPLIDTLGMRRELTWTGGPTGRRRTPERVCSTFASELVLERRTTNRMASSPKSEAACRNQLPKKAVTARTTVAQGIT